MFSHVCHAACGIDRTSDTSRGGSAQQAAGMPMIRFLCQPSGSAFHGHPSQGPSGCSAKHARRWDLVFRCHGTFSAYGSSRPTLLSCTSYAQAAGIPWEHRPLLLTHAYLICIAAPLSAQPRRRAELARAVLARADVLVHRVTPSDRGGETFTLDVASRLPRVGNPLLLPSHAPAATARDGVSYFVLDSAATK